MAKSHVMTPKRRAALKKAQTVSARKRRGHGKGKLAKANKTISRQRKVALVAATGGLALAAAGVAGHYYVRKTAGGGPKQKKINHGTSKVAGHTSNAPMMTRHNALRVVSQTRSNLTTGFDSSTRRTLMPKPIKGQLAISARASTPVRQSSRSAMRAMVPKSNSRVSRAMPTPTFVGSDGYNGNRGRVRRNAAKTVLAQAAHGRRSGGHRGDMRVFAVGSGGKAHVRNLTQIETMIAFDKTKTGRAKARRREVAQFSGKSIRRNLANPKYVWNL